MTDPIAGPTTEIEILSQAALICGKQTFNSVSGGGAFARDASAIFPTLASAELASNRWRFAQAFQSISTLTTLSPSFDGWLYYWDKPSDLIMLQYLDPMVDYIEFGNQVLTKTDQPLTAVYAKTVPVSKWPPAFSWYMVYQLASILAISVTNSERMVQEIKQERKEWRSRALFADGQTSRPQRIRSNPYIDIRYQHRTRRR